MGRLTDYFNYMSITDGSLGGQGDPPVHVRFGDQKPNSNLTLRAFNSNLNCAPHHPLRSSECSAAIGSQTLALNPKP